MNDVTGPSRPHRKAKQQRSQMTRQSICEAAVLLIREQGVETITTNKIAERAGVGIASIYRYYPNKESIISDIYELEIKALDEKMRLNPVQDLQGESLEKQISHALTFAMSYSHELLSVHRTFYQTYRQNFDITTRTGPDEESNWGTLGHYWLYSLLEHNSHRLRITNMEVATQMVMDTCTGYIHRIIETRPQDLTDPALVEELTEMICRYLIRDY